MPSSSIFGTHYQKANGAPYLSLAGLVRVCYERGPILKSISDAAVNDERLEKVWRSFLGKFDDAVTARIQQQQLPGMIAPFDARPIAIALNRMDAFLLIEAFGGRPRKPAAPVLAAITRIWVSTLYSDVTNTSTGGPRDGVSKQ